MFSNTPLLSWLVAKANLVFTVVIESALGQCLNLTILLEDDMFAGKISGIRLFMFERKNRVRIFQLSKNIIKNNSKPYKLFESGTHPYNGPTALITNTELRLIFWKIVLHIQTLSELQFPKKCSLYCNYYLYFPFSYL